MNTDETLVPDEDDRDEEPDEEQEREPDDDDGRRYADPRDERDDRRYR